MNCKGILSSEPLIEIERSRYDELVKKEKHFEIILGTLSRLSGYSNIDELKKYLNIEESKEGESNE